MLRRVIRLHKCTIPPDDRIAVSHEPNCFCCGLYHITAALNGHISLALNDLHQRIVDIFREINLALKAEIVQIKVMLRFLLIFGGKQYQRCVFSNLKAPPHQAERWVNLPIFPHNIPEYPARY